MEVQEVEISSLNPAKYNPRKINDRQMSGLKESLRKFGFVDPIIVNKRNMNIVGGHMRCRAAEELEYKTVPITYVDLSDSEEKALNVALNSHTISGDYDMDILPDLLKEIKTDESELFDGLNFDDFDVDLDIEVLEPQSDEDDVPEAPEEPVTKRGDVWLLGKHRLMCGDSTMIDDVEKLMNGEKADVLHTDPPYNVDYSNANRPKAGKQDLGYIKNDKMDNDSFYQFLYDSFVCGFNACKDDSMIYVWHASSEQINFTQALIDSQWDYKQQIIWKKPMLLGRGKYQWAHEPCLMGVKGKPWFTDDRTKTTVWDFGGYDKSKNIHPTQKPVFIPEEAINNSSKEGSIILDLFGGSGSTLIAAEKLNRKCNTMELDEKFMDRIINRWQNYTGKQATLESTGEKYNSLKGDS